MVGRVGVTQAAPQPPRPPRGRQVAAVTRGDRQRFSPGERFLPARAGVAYLTAVDRRCLTADDLVHLYMRQIGLTF